MIQSLSEPIEKENMIQDRIEADSSAEIIELNEFLEPEDFLFKGREKGNVVRTRTHIDEYAQNKQNVIVYIPKQIVRMTPSFLDAFLNNAVLYLGKEVFFKKIKFEPQNEYYKPDFDIKSSVDRILGYR